MAAFTRFVNQETWGLVLALPLTGWHEQGHVTGTLQSFLVCATPSSQTGQVQALGLGFVSIPVVTLFYSGLPSSLAISMSLPNVVFLEYNNSQNMRANNQRDSQWTKD